ncbi:unnamed protein product [Cochlearia groenlandica]
MLPFSAFCLDLLEESRCSVFVVLPCSEERKKGLFVRKGSKNGTYSGIYNALQTLIDSTLLTSRRRPLAQMFLKGNILSSLSQGFPINLETEISYKPKLEIPSLISLTIEPLRQS